jgi:glyoxylase-like metal-dependent hydrolase (beta-lactamase superfamily II)/8-oxo-dGTP pyrophosphatase MutT (NUDIX family)
VSQVTQASSVVLARSPGSREILVVRRAASLRFFGGYHAFPGGKVMPEDAEVPIRSGSIEIRDPQIAAAARELFEETGILLARRADNTFPDSTRVWDAERHDLLRNSLAFGPFLTAQGLSLHAEDFHLAGSLVTPAFSPVRFDTGFYVATQPPGQTVAVWPGELEEGFWTTPEDLLGLWAKGSCLVSPPTVSLLEALRGRPADDLPEVLAPLIQQLERGAIPPIYFAPGVQMLPLRTVGLPARAYTNAYLVGTTRLWLLDPGAHEPDEQERLFEALDARLAGGGRLEGVVLTHHHPDHVGAVSAVATRYRVPVLAHPVTAQALKGQVTVDRLLHEGDRLDLGETPDGAGAGVRSRLAEGASMPRGDDSPRGVFDERANRGDERGAHGRRAGGDTPHWQLEALFTPGHAGGHLVFYEPRYQLLFAGDMVSMLSSVVIAPPDGDLALYLESLRRLQRLDCRMLFPGHGAPTIRPREVINETLAHRAKREAQLLAALTGEPQALADLVEQLYRGLVPALKQLARLQVLAGLEKLSREGRVVRTGTGPEGGDRWALRAAAGGPRE